MTKEIRKAYTNQTRSWDGNPGPDYWQNSARYTINARFNSGRLKIHGKEMIDHQNHSALLIVPVAIGQQHKADPVADSLIAMEKAAWEAWINHDVDFFEDYLAEEAVLIHPNGRFNRSQQLEDVAGHPCKVKHYSLDNFEVIKLAEDVRLLTYESRADVICAGEVQPPRALTSVVYVRRRGAWVNVLFQDTPVAR